MAGRLFTSFWAKMSPYYTKAYPEIFVGVGIMTYLYYKVSYGGEVITLQKMQLFFIIQTVCSILKAILVGLQHIVIKNIENVNKVVLNTCLIYPLELQ